MECIAHIVKNHGKDATNIISERAINTRENLNIDFEGRPEVKLSSNVNDEKKVDGANMAHYSPLHGEIIVGDSVITGAAENVGSHELEHARQAFRYPELNSITDNTHQVLEGIGLIESTDVRDSNEIEKSALMEDLNQLGYSADSLATLASQNPGLKDKITNITEEYPDKSKENERALAQYKDKQIEYSDKRLNCLIDAINSIETYSPDSGVMRTGEEIIRAESEGFANFLDSYIFSVQSDSDPYWEFRADRIEDGYDDLIEELEVSVGQRAAERVRELSNVYDNLVEYSSMESDEAIEYIMNRVQDRKVEYANEQMEGFDSVDSVEQALQPNSSTKN